MVRQGGSVQLRNIYDDQNWWWGGNTGGLPCRVDEWWQNNETFAVWQEWMAHVKSVEQSDCSRCGTLIKVARCSDTMLWLYLGESEKVSQASSRAQKSDSGDIKSAKNRGRPKWHANRDDYWCLKNGQKWCSKKKTQRGDHHDGLVVLISKL